MVRSGVVVLLQPSADFSRLHPDDGIVSGSVAYGTLEKLGPQGALFQRFTIAL